MKAAFVVYPGKVMVGNITLDKTGKFPTKHFLKIRKAQDDEDGDTQYFALEVGLHEVNDKQSGLVAAYWPTSWADAWGRKELELFLFNEKKRQGVK